MKLHRTEKPCSACKIVKPLEAFGINNQYGDRRSIYCRECWSRYVNAKRHANGTQPRLSFLERLWSNVEQCGHEETCIFCCWPWLKSCDKDGYGKISLSHDSQTIYTPVTRVIYEIWHARPIPPGYLVCHFCDVPSCCNPLHLWLGTFNDNRQDCVRKGRTAKGFQTGYYTMPEAFPRGQDRPQARLTNEKVLAIRLTYSHGGITSRQLAHEYGVSKHTILSIINHKTWEHI